MSRDAAVVIGALDHALHARVLSGGPLPESATGIPASDFAASFRRWSGQLPSAVFVADWLTPVDSSADFFCAPSPVTDTGLPAKIFYGRAPTPFGDCTLGFSGAAICFLDFPAGMDAPDAERISRVWPEVALEPAAAGAATRAAQIVADPARQAVWLPPATSFRRQVWKALLRIPPGSVASYGQLAALLGRPEAARAVGQALAANSLAWLVPCHRVVPASGGIGQFRWGVARKLALLAWERAQMLSRHPAAA